MNPEFDPRDLVDIHDPYASEDRTALKVPDVKALPASPIRSQTLAVRLGALSAMIVCEVALVGVTGLRDKATVTSPVVAWGVVLPLASAAFAFAVLQTSSMRRTRVFTAIALGAFAFVASTLLARASGDESMRGMVGCVIGGGMMTAGPLMLAIFSMRHAFVTGATWRTAALGLASGLIGAAAVRLHCPNDAFVHVLAAHGAPILLVMLVAGLLGPRFTRA